VTEASKDDWDEMRRKKIALAHEKGRRRNSRILMGIAVVAVIVVVGAGVYMSLSAPKPKAPAQAGYASDHNETMVSVPLSSVGQTAKYYKWDAAGTTVRFFAVKGSDGQVRTAFDNAYCCYRKDLGERQEGSNMVCNMCNKPYPIDGLNHDNLNATMVASCCPADLPHIVIVEKVLVRKSDLAAGAYLFQH
jgi:uncharacterized membrane protein